MDLLYCLSMGSIIDYFRHYFKAYLLRVYPCEHTRRDLRLRKVEALSFPWPPLKVKLRLCCPPDGKGIGAA